MSYLLQNCSNNLNQVAKRVNESNQLYAADLEDWFEDAFGDKICSNLMEGQPINKVENCPVITEETIKYVFEILELEC